MGFIFKLSIDKSPKIAKTNISSKMSFDSETFYIRFFRFCFVYSRNFFKLSCDLMILYEI